MSGCLVCKVAKVFDKHIPSVIFKYCNICSFSGATELMFIFWKKQKVICIHKAHVKSTFKCIECEM